MIAYGYAPARRVLRRRREEQLLAGCRTARRHAAGRVSLQVRALEKRLGQTLLDRSGRRVEPTEAGLRLYRSAQRMLALEEQLSTRSPADSGELTGTLTIGASTGPARAPRAAAPLRVPARPPGSCTSRSPSATRRPSCDQVAAARARARHRRRAAPAAARSSSSRSSGRDRPRRARRATPLPGGRSRSTSCARRRLIAMQEGAGVRQVVEDELRRAGLRAARPRARLELGLQESVKSAVAAGYGVTFISRTAIEAELASGAARRRPGRRARPGKADLRRPGEGPPADTRGRRVPRVRAQKTS